MTTNSRTSVEDDLYRIGLPVFFGLTICLAVGWCFRLLAREVPNPGAILASFLVLAVVPAMVPLARYLRTTPEPPLRDLLIPLRNRVARSLAQLSGLGLFACWLVTADWWYFGVFGVGIEIAYWRRTWQKSRSGRIIGRDLLATAVIVLSASLLARHYGWGLHPLWVRINIISLLAAACGGGLWMADASKKNE